MKPENRSATLKKLTDIRRKPIRMSEDGPVEIEPIDSTHTLPVVIKPSVLGVSLPVWGRDHTNLIEQHLQKHGAVLFRGFGMNTQQDFEEFLAGISLDYMHYIEGATPRKKLGDYVYTSTEFPSEQTIAVHNELSYVLTWPMKVCFFCILPPEQGGETPITDVRKVYQRIPLEIRQRFLDKGWMLLRNFGDGLGLTWQSAFRTSDKSEVENYFTQARIDWEWKDETRLRTRQVRPATAIHPKTSEVVWFNHIAFWHVSNLKREVLEMLLKEFGEYGLPYNTYYGDGSTIEDSVIEELRHAYESETVTFPWEKGDLLITDNMLAAHGRRPYVGQRRIIVSMGDPYTRTDF